MVYNGDMMKKGGNKLMYKVWCKSRIRNKKKVEKIVYYSKGAETKKDAIIEMVEETKKYCMFNWFPYVVENEYPNIKIKVYGDDCKLVAIYFDFDARKERKI